MDFKSQRYFLVYSKYLLPLAFQSRTQAVVIGVYDYDSFLFWDFRTSHSACGHLIPKLKSYLTWTSVCQGYIFLVSFQIGY